MTFSRFLAILNVLSYPYFGYLVYKYMWVDSWGLTFLVWMLFLVHWLDYLVEALSGETKKVTWS